MTALQDGEIRILVHEYSALERIPRLVFRVVSLDNPPPFVALSYVWGDLADTLPLRVGGQIIQATRNLHDILDSLQASNYPQKLWIDALCINQDDFEERASQVAMMGDIYSRAEYVLAFLSSESGPFDLGLDFMEKTAKNPEIHFDPSLSPHLTVDSSYRALFGLTASHPILQSSIVEFFGTPWFTRVWTVQEFLLAKKVIFRCGKRLIDAEVVTKCCRSWIDHSKTCCWSADQPRHGHSHGFIDTIWDIRSNLTLYTATLRMKPLMDMSRRGRLHCTDFLTAISLFRIRQCSDPRDRIYGFSGLYLTGIDVKRDLQVDYKVSTALLFRNTATSLIEKTQTLDVLSHVLHESGIEKRVPELPSWAPDWDATMDDRHHLLYTDRADRISHCRASGDLKPNLAFRAPDNVFIRGLRIGRVKAIAPGYPSIYTDSADGGKETIDSWRQLAGLPEALSSEEDVKETTFQNALSGGFTDLPWEIGSAAYSKAYKLWLEWFISTKPSLPVECKEIIQEFDDLMHQTSMYRCFILADNGELGFGPDITEVGDVIIILPGGKVPYVLRQVEVSFYGTITYRLLGDAYINGAMAGEKVCSGMSDFEDMFLV
ncbi:hypothetical protein FPOAC1_009857 [Fusarium poae]|uniref:hypothetical protein n=1 Tax=Fusarium poae TaxID=36050 RepID=UPI001CE86618|nr:hypothetical protein FPOAC1_009857 [Fusarium poae]KAG8670443.1 hypothetical protein FPOAC1_009857 [Fusarium poae]